MRRGPSGKPLVVFGIALAGAMAFGCGPGSDPTCPEILGVIYITAEGEITENGDPPRAVRSASDDVLEDSTDGGEAAWRNVGNLGGRPRDITFSGVDLTVAFRLPVEKGDVLAISEPLTERSGHVIATSEVGYFTKEQIAVGNYYASPSEPEAPVAGTLTILETSPPVIAYDLTATDANGNDYAFTGTFSITKGTVENPECD